MSARGWSLAWIMKYNGEVTVGLAHNSESAVNWIYAWAGTLGQEFNERVVRTEVK